MPGFEVIGAEERAAVVDVFDSGGILVAHGMDAQRDGRFRVRELEQDVCRLLAAGHTQAVSSGSAALWCAMAALGVGPGDEVITQAFTFVATVEAIVMRGATPIVVDVDESLNLAPAALEAAITPRTKLIVPVHMAGVPARMDEIMEIARLSGVAVLEDAAQALGASYRGRALGTIGDVGVVSLDFGKVITCGEGGLVITNRQDIYEDVRAVHDHGHDYAADLPRGIDRHRGWGFNFRMTEIQAAVARAQLAKLDYIVETQRASKRMLADGIRAAGLPISFRDLPDPAGDNGDTLFFFCETPRQAARTARELADAGIGTKNVPDALDWHFAGRWPHLLGRYYDDLPLQDAFSNTDRLLQRAVAVPIWLRADADWRDRVVDAVSASLRSF